jgi:hypothetical protein
MCNLCTTWTTGRAAELLIFVCHIFMFESLIIDFVCFYLLTSQEKEDIEADIEYTSSTFPENFNLSNFPDQGKPVI